MKKVKFIVPAMLAMILAGCNTSSNDNVNQKAGRNALMENVAVDSLTSIELIDSIEEISEIVEEIPEVVEEEAQEETIVDEKLVLVNKYIEMFDTLTSEDAIKINLVDCDREGFAYLMTFEANLPNTEKQSFQLYYNQVIEELEDNVDEEVVEDEIEEEQEELEDEIVELGRVKAKHHDQHEHKRFEYQELRGLLVYGENEYEVEGYSLTSEEKTKTSFEAKLSDGKSVKISSSLSESKKEYKYELRDGEKVVAKNKLKIEKEEDFVSLKLEIENENSKEKYVISKENFEGEEIYKIRYCEEENKGLIIAYVDYNDAGEKVVTYEFKDGQQHQFNHGHHHGHGGHGGHGGHHGCGFGMDFDWEDSEFEYGDLDEEWFESDDDTMALLESLLKELGVEDFDLEAFLENYYADYEEFEDNFEDNFEDDFEDYEFNYCPSFNDDMPGHHGHHNK